MYLTFSPAKLSALRTRIAYLPPEADHVAVLVAAAKGTHATEAEALAYAAAEGPAVVLSVARHRNAAEDARVAADERALADLRARRPLPERRRLLSKLDWLRSTDLSPASYPEYGERSMPFFVADPKPSPSTWHTGRRVAKLYSRGVMGPHAGG